jgi:hypothetical protein
MGKNLGEEVLERGEEVRLQGGRGVEGGGEEGERQGIRKEVEGRNWEGSAMKEAAMVEGVKE